MKTISLTPLLFLFMLACQSPAPKQNTETAEAVDSIAVDESIKTYAEISIKEGGTWNGRKYEGGTTFVNVDQLLVPAQHTDHSFFIRYEGPGWESSKVGYRLYLDWRNAIDIFGKLDENLILNQVGQDGFESYHHASPWGQDILKVGKGLGIGSLGRLVNGEVLHFNNVDSTAVKVENKASASSVHVNYYGWETANEKTDLTSTLAIKPGVRYTKHTIQNSASLSGICTGIVDHKVARFENTSENKKWAYIATYGAQTLVPDSLGMAVFYATDNTEKTLAGPHDHLIVFKATPNPISFYFLGAWEQEKNGIRNQADFLTYLNDLLTQLNKNDEL